MSVIFSLPSYKVKETNISNNPLNCYNKTKKLIIYEASICECLKFLTHWFQTESTKLGKYPKVYSNLKQKSVKQNFNFKAVNTNQYFVHLQFVFPSWQSYNLFNYYITMIELCQWKTQFINPQI